MTRVGGLPLRAYTGHADAVNAFVRDSDAIRVVSRRLGRLLGCSTPPLL